MKVFFACLFFLQSSLCFSQDSIINRIVLVGDGGLLENGRHPVAQAIRKTVPMDARTTIVYLGDNLYSTGLPDIQAYETYKAAKNVLDSQLSIAEGTAAKIYMIPGNHDWKNGAPDGFDAIIREQLYVDVLSKNNVEFYPKDGCPGPKDVKLGSDVVLVMFDSQWFLHPYEKPGIESDCDFKTPEEVLAQLDDIFTSNPGKLFILACHHTFKSISPHGGYYTWKQHIFPFTDISKNLWIPLPIIGSIYPITRAIFGTPQDLRHPNYQKMITDVQRVAQRFSPNIIYAAGHDHSLQLIQDSSYYIVSGSGSKTNRVSTRRKESLFGSDKNGFSVVEVSKDKWVTVKFYTVVNDSIELAYTNTILNFTKIESTSADTSTVKVENPELVKYKDTINIAASDRYKSKSIFRNLIMGKNYRAEWSTPVNMKVFNIRKEKGGLTVTGFGGGQQTRTLTLKDKKGREWILKVLDKNPERVIPENFRALRSNEVSKDFISSTHPYAPMPIPILAQSLGLTVPIPELFFVPDDPALGPYRSTIAGTVCYMEEKNPVPKGVEVKGTTSVFNKLIEENDHRVNQPEVLKARLLDLIIGDFDRHFGQWRWVVGDTGKGKLYYPIPRDRDQAFFKNTGLLVRLIEKKLLPVKKGFHTTIPDVNWQAENSRDFDRMFLTDLDGNEWKTIIKEVQEGLNDSVINRAVRELPPEIYAIDGNNMMSKLKSRRANLERAAIKYYEFLSKKVNIVGSNKDEYFKINSVPEGLNVKVYGLKKNKDTSILMYDRTFDSRVTKELRLYGLLGDDRFEVTDTTSSRIRLRIIGGRGNDTFDIKGNVRNYLYDLNGDSTSERNTIRSQNRSKNKFSTEPPVNQFALVGFQYNHSNFPNINTGFNTDDGYLLSVGFSRTAYGFRNEPYANFQRYKSIHSFSRPGHQLSFYGEYNHTIKDFDLVLNAEIMFPGISNYFGQGNERQITKPIDFYKSSYSHVELDVLLQKRLFPPLRVLGGLTYYQYWNDIRFNNNKVLGTFPNEFNLTYDNIYSSKTYIGGKVQILVNNLNNDLYPTRGVKWTTEFTGLLSMNSNSKTMTKLTTDMTVYASISDVAPVIAVFRLGSGKIYSRNFEYFQALDLGADNHLRGFNKNRFAGRSTLYAGLELRYRLANINSYFLPGPIGLIAFDEIGRVFLQKDTSRRWHNSFGGGMYLVPYNLFVLSATMAFSPETHIFNFSINTKFGLNFLNR